MPVLCVERGAVFLNIPSESKRNSRPGFDPPRPNVHVAAAASPRLVPADYPARGRGVAATRFRGVFSRRWASVAFALCDRIEAALDASDDGAGSDDEYDSGDEEAGDVFDAAAKGLKEAMSTVENDLRSTIKGDKKY